MSQSESPIRELEDEDNIISTEEVTATADIAIDEHSSGEIDEPILTKNGDELTSLEPSEFEFVMSKQCTNIVHCREIM